MVDILTDALRLAEHTAISPEQPTELGGATAAIKAFAGFTDNGAIPYSWHRDAYGELRSDDGTSSEE